MFEVGGEGLMKYEAPIGMVTCPKLQTSNVKHQSFLVVRKISAQFLRLPN